MWLVIPSSEWAVHGSCIFLEGAPPHKTAGSASLGFEGKGSGKENICEASMSLRSSVMS
jgi:hypothetical protein